MLIVDLPGIDQPNWSQDISIEDSIEDNSYWLIIQTNRTLQFKEDQYKEKDGVLPSKAINFGKQSLRIKMTDKYNSMRQEYDDFYKDCVDFKNG